MVKELTEVMGGQIRVESQVDIGSRFIVSVPFTAAQSSISEDVTEEDAEEYIEFAPFIFNGNKPKVLIVEDDLEMSNYLISLLHRDYDCEAAYNGLQALAKVKKNKYDLISSDIMMPEMDGFEFRERVNQDEMLRTTPFIMLTARILEDDKLKGFQLGIDDYITKPFSSSEFKARVHNLLKNKVDRDQAEKDDDVTENVREKTIDEAYDIVSTHLDDLSFSVESFAEKMNYSSRQLGRILKKHCGLSPVAFILEVRLQKAYQLLKSGTYQSIKEVRYEVGIESASYFTSKFKERFGVNPTHLL